MIYGHCEYYTKYPSEDEDLQGNLGIQTVQQAIRLFEPCILPTGECCTVFEDPINLHLLEERWYPPTARIFDGSFLILRVLPTHGQCPKTLDFLKWGLPTNLFRQYVPAVFMVANNQSIICDLEANIEMILPDIPNNVRVIKPIDGSAILLPLSPPNCIPAILLCGPTDDPTDEPLVAVPGHLPVLSHKAYARGIAKGREVEHIFEDRMMPELTRLPNGQVLIANGARPSSRRDRELELGPRRPQALTLHARPAARAAHQQQGATDDGHRARVPLEHHAHAEGQLPHRGQQPDGNFTAPAAEIKFASELRVETLDPPFMFVDRPKILSAPAKVPFNSRVTVPISVPAALRRRNAKVQISLMDLGFSSHAFHSSARLVFMEGSIAPDGRSLTFFTPPSGRVYPPGPATIFLTIDDVSSEGAWVIVGSGNPPPTLE
ncbi:hypothetical protein V8D89_003945 [Ganoderma adspersum]